IIKILMVDLLHLQEVLDEVKLLVKLLDESQVLLKVPRQKNMYSFDLMNVVPSRGLTCLFAKAIIDESNLWHRRLGHINFKNINKLVRGNIVRGLHSKLFENDQTCVASQKGKQHKASCKTKTVSSICKPLQLLHMDLFGPFSMKSINKKSYCLVVTDDFIRFSWVFFLATKDKTPEILKNFITGIKNQTYQKVKTIRCDNGTEFKNRIMNEFYEMKGIRREFSVSRTPQQNGNQTNGNAGNKANIDEGQGGMKTVPGPQYVLLPFLTFDSQSPKSSEDEVADDAGKKNGVLDPAKEDDKSGQGEATNTNSTNRLNIVSSSINTVSSSFTTMMFTLINADGSSCDNLYGSIPIKAATLPNANFPTDPLMPGDTTDLLNTGIFSGAFDDEDGLFFLKIEAISLFLAYASFIRFIVYQMDVKRAFLYEKALYGLHQAPKAWYETLSTNLLENRFRRGTIDKALFIKKDKDDAQEIPDEFYGGAHFLLRVIGKAER
ncbi:putative ribonuclease H-like domain-containing protein, partial [Tanacetum coccineum]